MTTTAYLNRIATAVPEHDVHAAFIDFAAGRLAGERERAVFRRMVERSGIDHRWSTLAPAPPGSNVGPERDGFYMPGAFPSTAARMRLFEREAPKLAVRALDRLALGRRAAEITHVLLVTCTGFMAPGVDLAVVRHLGLPSGVERTQVGFMGCAAALNALKLARHIVRSEPDARVLILSVELCTLHLHDEPDLEQLLSFLIFGDGCAAAVVSRDPVGIALDRFATAVAPQTEQLITWSIGDRGFDMVLSGRVPGAIRETLRACGRDLLGGRASDEVAHWAVHPGGRSVLDAVAASWSLPPAALAPSRAVLKSFGNMSSATVLFVLERILADGGAPDAPGCAVAFGPGVAAESMMFRIAA
jgi:predicted naringenin-chalcone synthase